MHDELAARGRPGDERTGPPGRRPAEVVGPGRRGVEVGPQLGLDAVEHAPPSATPSTMTAPSRPTAAATSSVPASDARWAMGTPHPPQRAAGGNSMARMARAQALRQPSDRCLASCCITGFPVARSPFSGPSARLKVRGRPGAAGRAPRRWRSPRGCGPGRAARRPDGRTTRPGSSRSGVTPASPAKSSAASGVRRTVKWRTGSLVRTRTSRSSPVGVAAKRAIMPEIVDDDRGGVGGNASALVEHDLDVPGVERVLVEAERNRLVEARR